MLKKLRLFDTYENLILTICNTYLDLFKNGYLPALIDEGSLFDKNIDEDFYLKTIIKPNDIPLDETWLVSNLVPYTLVNEKIVYNIVTWINYKHNKLYSFNPLLLNDETLINYEQLDNVIHNQLYLSYSEKKEYPLLTHRNNNKDIIYFFLPSIIELLDKQYDNLNLCIEFEYRTKNFNPEKFKNTDVFKQDGVYLDINISEDILWIRGTIYIPTILLEEKIKQSKEKINVSVYEFPDNVKRPLNPNNYNDDMSLGLLPFTSDVYEFLSDYYYIYPLEIISKTDLNEKYIVDSQMDVCIFTEGNFNNLPMNIKKSLVPFSITNNVEFALSADMQNKILSGIRLNSDNLSPFNKIAYDIFQNHFNLAIEKNMNFIFPNNIKSLQNYINFVDSVYHNKEQTITLDSGELIDLKNLSFDLSKKEMINITDTYCNYIVRNFI